MADGPALRPAPARCACLANARYAPCAGRQAGLSNELEPPLGGGSGERCASPPGAKQSPAPARVMATTRQSAAGRHSRMRRPPSGDACACTLPP